MSDFTFVELVLIAEALVARDTDVAQDLDLLSKVSQLIDKQRADHNTWLERTRASLEQRDAALAAREANIRQRLNVSRRSTDELKRKGDLLKAELDADRTRGNLS